MESHHHFVNRQLRADKWTAGSRGIFTVCGAYRDGNTRFSSPGMSIRNTRWSRVGHISL